MVPTDERKEYELYLIYKAYMGRDSSGLAYLTGAGLEGDWNLPHYGSKALSVSAHMAAFLKTLPHEIGHNLSLRHDQANTNDQTITGLNGPLYNFGYRNNTQGFRTLMAYSSNLSDQNNKCGEVVPADNLFEYKETCVSLSEFSNPNRLYNGFLIGTTTADNARKIREMEEVLFGPTKIHSYSHFVWPRPPEDGNSLRVKIGSPQFQSLQGESPGGLTLKSAILSGYMELKLNNVSKIKVFFYPSALNKRYLEINQTLISQGITLKAGDNIELIVGDRLNKQTLSYLIVGDSPPLSEPTTTPTPSLTPTPTPTPTPILTLSPNLTPTPSPTPIRTSAPTATHSPTPQSPSGVVPSGIRSAGGINRHYQDCGIKDRELQ